MRMLTDLFLIEVLVASGELIHPQIALLITYICKYFENHAEFKKHLEIIVYFL